VSPHTLPTSTNPKPRTPTPPSPRNRHSIWKPGIRTSITLFHHFLTPRN
jgi:hypothetical protein